MLKSVFHLNRKLSNIVLSNRVNKQIFKMSNGVALKTVVAELEKFAPINLAENWDNVGLLLEPYKPRPIKKILLTNDLTECVMNEAVDKEADMIISYHPPIFAPLNRITQKHWKMRIVAMCLGESIALYSPHTCWDAVIGGVNDWLSSALPIIDMKAILPNPQLPIGGGAGRIFTTDTTLGQAINSVQKHIGLDVHLAKGVNHNMNTPIKVAAVCAGSGASLFKGLSADLYVTGEMSHHEVLDATQRNVSVILCNHSNSERGFLKHFQPTLTEMLKGECEILLSEADEDPIKTCKQN